MYSLTFQCFRAILGDRHQAPDATGCDDAEQYFNIKHNEKESTSIGTRRIMDLLSQQRGSRNVLADCIRYRAGQMGWDIMLRGNEERWMEHGFGVAGLNGCGRIMYAISSDGTACYSGDVFDRDRKWTGRVPEDREESKTY